MAPCWRPIIGSKDPAMLFSFGSETAVLSSEDLREALFGALASLGDRRKVLAIPPDFSRYHSGAGELTELIWQYFGERLGGVLPAIGTHRPMTADGKGVWWG